MTQHQKHMSEPSSENTQDHADATAIQETSYTRANPFKTDYGTLVWYTKTGERKELHPGYNLTRGKETGRWRLRKQLDGKRITFDTGCFRLDAAIERAKWIEAFPRVALEEQLRHGLVDKGKGKSLENCIEQYAKYLRAKNCHVTTLHRIIPILNKFAALTGKQMRVGSVRQSHVEEYLLGLQTSVKPNTLRLHFKSIRQFFSWCRREDLIAISPFRKLPTPIEQVTQIDERRIIEAHEIQRLMDACYDDGLACALFVLWATGLRFAELHRMQIEDVNHIDYELFVRSVKNKKSRRIPIADAETLAACVGWIAFKLSDGRFREKLYWACKRAGMQQISPHLLRHSRITLWLREGCSPVDVMAWSGHSNIMITMRYVSAMKKAVKRPAPTGLRAPVTNRKTDTNTDSPRSDDRGNDEP